MSVRLNNKEFKIRANKKHHNQYDYSLVEYINTHTKIKIICKKHGVFEQEPRRHMRGEGCRKCADEKFLKGSDKFIRDAIKVHGNEYNYCNVKYVNAISDVEIVCGIHGSFKQIANNHLQGYGCPKCVKKSKGEIKIKKWLIENEIKFTEQKKFEDCKYVNHLLFDFYLDELNILIEYDGEQHFKPIEIWGGSMEFDKIIERDRKKDEFAEKNKLKLIRVSYKDKKNLNEILNLNIKKTNNE